MLVMDLLGPSLEDLFNFCGRELSIKTVLMLVDQVDVVVKNCLVYLNCNTSQSHDKAQLIGLSPSLGGLTCFLSHRTFWALLADDLRWPGFKSRLGHEFSVGWTNGRYAMRLISPTGTQGPPVSSLKL